MPVPRDIVVIHVHREARDLVHQAGHVFRRKHIRTVKRGLRVHDRLARGIDIRLRGSLGQTFDRHLGCGDRHLYGAPLGGHNILGQGLCIFQRDPGKRQLGVGIRALRIRRRIRNRSLGLRNRHLGRRQLLGRRKHLLFLGRRGRRG